MLRGDRALLHPVVGIVILRYGFGGGFHRIAESASYAFAVFVIFRPPVCMAQDGQCARFEVLSKRLSAALPASGRRGWLWSCC